jgi:hypothetical protein
MLASMCEGGGDGKENEQQDEICDVHRDLLKNSFAEVRMLRR